MKYEKKIEFKEKSQAELSVTIKKAEVDTRYQDLLKKYSKELQIPGFRKGKVPVKILEQKYGDAIVSDLTGDLVEDSLKEIFDSLDEYERPLQYSYPELKEKPELKIGKNFTFVVNYDVFPKIDIKKTEGFEIEVPEVKVSEADIKEELKNVQDRNALVSNCKADEKAKKDHIATINYCELDEEGKEIEGSAREDFVFTIGTKQNLFELDDEIIGMKAGETKEITKEFPEDHHDSELAGKTKKIKVELKVLKFKDLPPIDDELAQDVSEKYKTLDDLKADIKKNMEDAIDSKIKKIKEKAVIDQIVADTEIPVPDSMIRAELESNWIMMARQFQTTPEDLEKIFAGSGGKSKAEIQETWREDAVKKLKDSLVVETLLKNNKIEVSDEEIDTEYKKIAEANNMSIEDLKKYYQQQNQDFYFVEGVKEDKLFNQIFDKSKIKKGKKLKMKEFFAEENPQVVE